jgi:hypothetical protein
MSIVYCKCIVHKHNYKQIISTLVRTPVYSKQKFHEHTFNGRLQSGVDEQDSLYYMAVFFRRKNLTK